MVPALLSNRSSPTDDFKQLCNTVLNCPFSFLSYKKGRSCFPAESNRFRYPKSETSHILSTAGKHWAPWVTGSLQDSQLGHKAECKLQQGNNLPGSKSWHPGGLVVPCKNSTHDLGSLSFSILIQPCVSFVSSHNSLDILRGLFVTPIHLSFLSCPTSASAVLHQYNTNFSVNPVSEDQAGSLPSSPFPYSPTPCCQLAQSLNFHLCFCQVHGFLIDWIDGHFFLVAFLFLLEFQKCT